MKKLVYLLPTVAALALAGCGDDTAADTDDGSSTGEDPTGSPTTNDPTVDPGTTTDETTTDPTIDPDTGGSDSSGEPPPMCGADDECTPETVVDDCGDGFVCLGCLCVEDGDAPLCPDGWNNEGTYGDCGMGEECGGGDLQVACAGGPSDSSVCLYLGCEELCDCPQPPEGFEGLARCEDQFGPNAELDGINDCFLDCSGGETCPDGMACFGGVCYHGEEAPFPDYDDCLNQDLPICDTDGLCLSDGATFGACASIGCNDASDCGDAPATGTAMPGCTDFPDGSVSFCSLTCDDGETCPDGMFCLPLALGGEGIGSHCLWPPAPEAGYGDCAAMPDNVCLDSETCVANSGKGSGDTEICAASACVDPMTDCPDVPATGDAVAACQDIDGMKGDECVLDCSGGAMCPDGAVCTDDGFCAYPTPTFTFEEDFEGGVLPKGWTVHDVDGQPTAPQTAFVDAAWVIGDDIDGPNFSAISTSWYVPAGQSDDWIISPAITLGATATLSWNARATDPGFPDGYEVYVVPSSVSEFTGFIAGGDPTDFLALDEMVVPSAAPVFEVANEETELQWRSVDLASVAAQEVYIAFRNNSDDLNLLLVDNIWVTE